MATIETDSLFSSINFTTFEVAIEGILSLTSANKRALGSILCVSIHDYETRISEVNSELSIIILFLFSLGL